MSLSTELQGRIDKVYENLIGLKQQQTNQTSPVASRTPDQIDKLFDKLDKNSDGVISRDEWTEARAIPHGSSSRSTSPSPARVLQPSTLRSAYQRGLV